VPTHQHQHTASIQSIQSDDVTGLRGLTTPSPAFDDSASASEVGVGSTTAKKKRRKKKRRKKKATNFKGVAAADDDRVSDENGTDEDELEEDDSRAFEVDVYVTEDKPGSFLSDQPPRTLQLHRKKGGKGEVQPAPQGLDWCPTHAHFMHEINRLLRKHGDEIDGHVWQVGPYAGGDMHGRIEFFEWERMCTEPEWAAAMDTFPWLLSAKRSRLATHLTYAAFAATHNKAEGAMQLTSRAAAVHALWELACDDGNLPVFFTDDTVTLLQQFLDVPPKFNADAKLRQVQKATIFSAAAVLWKLALHRQPQGVLDGRLFEDQLIHHGIVESLVCALMGLLADTERSAAEEDITPEGTFTLQRPFVLSADDARLYKILLTMLALFTRLPEGWSRLMKPDGEPDTPAEAVEVWDCWHTLMRVATLTTLKHVHGTVGGSLPSDACIPMPHAEQLGVALLQRVLATSDGHASVVTHGRVGGLVGIVQRRPVTLKASVAALFASLCADGRWEAVAADDNGEALFPVLVRLCEGVTAAALKLKRDGEAEAARAEEEAKRRRRPLPPPAALPPPTVEEQACLDAAQRLEERWNDSLAWMRVGHGVWGAAKAVSLWDCCCACCLLDE